LPELNAFDGKPSTRVRLLRDVRQNCRFLLLQENGAAGSNLKKFLMQSSDSANDSWRCRE